METHEHDLGDHRPEPNAALELMMVLAEAFVVASDRRVVVAFVCELAEALRRHQDGEVVNMSRDAPARIRARREAMAELRRKLPELVRLLGVTDT